MMYDGRVGAALGLLARIYLEKCGEKIVQQELPFRWGRPASGPIAKRNPSLGGFVFAELPYPSSDRRASLIRAELVRVTGQIIRQAVEKLRDQNITVSIQEFEKALFMIGYDVTPHAP